MIRRKFDRLSQIPSPIRERLPRHGEDQIDRHRRNAGAANCVHGLGDVAALMIALQRREMGVLK